MKIKPVPKKPVQRRNIPHCDDILSNYEAAIGWDDLKARVGDFIKKQNDPSVSIILSLETEDYGDSTYLRIRWTENESDAAFKRRMADYEARLAEYKLWKKANAKAIKAEMAIRTAGKEKKEELQRKAKIAKLEAELTKLKKP